MCALHAIHNLSTWYVMHGTRCPHFQNLLKYLLSQLINFVVLRKEYNNKKMMSTFGFESQKLGKLLFILTFVDKF